MVAEVGGFCWCSYRPICLCTASTSWGFRSQLSSHFYRVHWLVQWTDSGFCRHPLSLSQNSLRIRRRWGHPKQMHLSPGGWQIAIIFSPPFSHLSIILFVGFVC